MTKIKILLAFTAGMIVRSGLGYGSVPLVTIGVVMVLAVLISPSPKENKLVGNG
jgi:hypothetical protein